MTISNIILFITVLCAGLMAGLFYSYSCSVIPGLAKLPDEQYLAAMQSINRAIQNPVFFVSFFGVLVLLPLSTYLKYSQPVSPGFWLILAATVIYLAGSFGITVFGNIPLNNALDHFDIAGSSKETIHAHRIFFERPWNNLNFVRTGSSILSFVLVIIACIFQGDNK